jgi:hypothetical protein
MARRQAASRRFKFQKRSQLFIRAHNEALTAAMRVNDEDFAYCAAGGVE